MPSHRAGRSDELPLPAAGRPNIFRVVATVWVIAGGLVAAVTGPLNLEHGSWAAAYLVLVMGVAQSGLGTAQAALADPRPSSRVVAGQLVTWNLGSLAVIGGTLSRLPLIVDAGGVLLIASLALLIRTVGGRGRDRDRVRAPAWALWTYRGLLTVILVSVPVGLALAHLRAA